MESGFQTKDDIITRSDEIGSNQDGLTTWKRLMYIWDVMTEASELGGGQN